MKKLLIILLLLLWNCVSRAQERMSVGHVVNRKSGLEEITANYYSTLADTVRFTFYCAPDNGQREYQIFALKNKKADAISGIFCPQKVIIETRTAFSTHVDSLNVAIIRKINQGHIKDGHY